MANIERKAGERPPHVKPPKHLSKNPPVPEPEPADKNPEAAEKDDPTRYGDWVHKGIAVDF